LKQPAINKHGKNKIHFSSPKFKRRNYACRIKQVSIWVPGALSPRIKWSGCEAAHLHPSSVKVKNAWSCTSTLYVFMV
jgi:hypothetical protein